MFMLICRGIFYELDLLLVFCFFFCFVLEVGRAFLSLSKNPILWDSILSVYGEREREIKLRQRFCKEVSFLRHQLKQQIHFLSISPVRKLFSH